MICRREKKASIPTIPIAQAPIPPFLSLPTPAHLRPPPSAPPRPPPPPRIMTIVVPPGGIIPPGVQIPAGWIPGQPCHITVTLTAGGTLPPEWLQLASRFR